jgi:pimeloyl-ACP methyl ester carboxylesterase
MRLAALTLITFALAGGTPATAAAPASVVETKYIDSRILEDNRVGLSLHRSLKVYLPPGYAKGKARYPVVYMLHGLNWSNERMFAPESTIQRTFDQAIADGVIRPFIAVAPDYTTSGPGTFYANSSTAGRFEDFTLQEVIPFVDANYRTLAAPASRAIMGEHMGAYGALLYAFRHPEVFGMVYGLHPVGTGSGLVPMYSRPDWKRVYAAKSFADISGNPGDPYTPVFVAMAQAFLPNPDRPPFYCDFIMESVNGEPQLHVANLQLLKSRFMLEKVVVDQLDKVRALRGIKFDWGRYDPNQDHVYANQAFTRKLDELGIEHEAEEYRGLPWDKYWSEDGRVYNDVLPFFARRLKF